MRLTHPRLQPNLGDLTTAGGGGPEKWLVLPFDLGRTELGAFLGLGSLAPGKRQLDNSSQTGR